MPPLTLLGHVSTEGGPLLIADRDTTAMWTGVFGESGDYARACEQLDANSGSPGLQLEVNNQTAIIWDMPTGSAEVWRRPDSALVVTRTWLEPGDNRAGFLASLRAENPLLLGGFTVTSGWLAILWAAESGQEIGQHPSTDGAVLDLSVGHAGILAAVPPGDYACYHDEVADGPEVARRCLIIPRSAQL